MCICANGELVEKMKMKMKMKIKMKMVLSIVYFTLRHPSRGGWVALLKRAYVVNSVKSDKPSFHFLI